jgi:hypothetical protein
MTVTVLPKAVVTQIDTDGDNVPDAIDKCPSTPTGRTVNSLGCPLPKITEFPNTTNLTNIDLNKVTTFELANTYGRISYQETSSPYVLVRNSDRLDIDAATAITQGKVVLDGSTLPELNRPAVITLYNMKLTKPGIKRNGAPCAGCSEIVYNPSLKTITFKVPGFSTYEIFDDEEEVFDVPVEIIAPTPTSKVGSTGGGSRRISKTGTLTPSPRTNTPQGNTTRAKASEIFALLTFLNIKLTPTQTAAILQAFPESTSVSPSTTSLSCTVLTREMWLGHTDANTGGQVSKLQLFLIAKGYLPAGTPLGYYGALTTSAVTKFQLEKGIVSGGTLSTTGIGGVGVRTMGVVKSGSCY